MDIDFKKSIDRATKLMGTPVNYENYSIIKIIPSTTKCCCFHCLPNAWASINENVSSFGSIEDEGDLLIEKNNEKFVIECHESGPEFVIYSIATGLVVEGIIKLIAVFLKGIKKDYKHARNYKIIKSYHIKGHKKFDEVIEIEIPLDDVALEKLNSRLRKALEK